MVGAASAHLIDAARQRRRDQHLSQRAILSDVVLLVADYKAMLMEFDEARRLDRGNEGEHGSRQFFPALTRLQGRVTHTGILLWQAYSDLRVRAAYEKLRSRLEKTEAMLKQDELPPEVHVECAYSWIDEQLQKTADLAAAEARIRTKHRPLLGVAWIGWGEQMWERREDLSWEDHAPPWEPDVQLRFWGRQPGEERATAMRQAMLAKIADLRCSEHGLPAHVTVRGRLRSFDMRVKTCCDEFSGVVQQTLRRN